jgi:PAS domain S-box-containing protein
LNPTPAANPDADELALLRDAIRHAPIGVCRVDVCAGGLITFVNAALTRVTGYAESELIGRDWAEVLFPGPLRSQLDRMMERLSSGPILTCETTIATKSGGQRRTRWNVIDRRAADGTLVEIIACATPAEEAIGRLAGGAAHDVNNLMVTVIGLAALVRRHLGDDHSQASMLRDIERAGETASQLANQLAAYARRPPPRADRINLNHLIEEVRLLCQAGLPNRIALDVDLDPQLPEVLADPGHIKEMIVTLALAAADATPEADRIRVTTTTDRLTAAFKDAPSSLVGTPLAHLTVVGLRPHTEAPAAEPPSAAKPRGREPAPTAGWAIGWATVQDIARNCDGYAYLDTGSREGPTFHVFLPACDK